MSKELRVDFLNMSTVAAVSTLDGVHFPAHVQEDIATAVYGKVAEIFPNAFDSSDHVSLFPVEYNP